MRAPGFILAYHGCDRAIGERILKNQEQVSVSENEYDWLGAGAYFWENSPARALEWARFVQKHPQNFRHKIQKPFVVGAIIDPGNCLDLTDAESLTIVSSGFELLKKSMHEAGVSLPKNVPSHDGDSDLVKRYLDCAVINFVHEIRAQEKLPAFDTVRGTFTEGNALYPGAKIMAKTHGQICIREPQKQVIAYFRPRHFRD